jgi:hypothetical protein
VQKSAPTKYTPIPISIDTQEHVDIQPKRGISIEIDRGRATFSEGEGSNETARHKASEIKGANLFQF